MRLGPLMLSASALASSSSSLLQYGDDPTISWLAKLV
jgi:hypothetical protein